MNELEDIRQRLQTVEIDLEIRKDLEQTYLKLLFAAIRVLHAHSPEGLQQWLGEVRSASAFAQGAHDKKPPQTLEALVSSLQVLLDALSKSGRSQ